jgi:organic hydroperoxide reductase OsmC/OhrA
MRTGIRFSAPVAVRPDSQTSGRPDARSTKIAIMKTLFTAEAISKTCPYSKALRGDTSVTLVVD